MFKRLTLLAKSIGQITVGLHLFTVLKVPRFILKSFLGK